MILDVFVDASSHCDGLCRYGFLIMNGDEIVSQGTGFYFGSFASSAAENIACDMAFRVLKIHCRKIRKRTDKIVIHTDLAEIARDYKRPRLLKSQYHHPDGVTERNWIPIEYKLIPSRDNKAHLLVSEVHHA